jgi:hypothetical protein
MVQSGKWGRRRSAKLKKKRREWHEGNAILIRNSSSATWKKRK